MSVKINQVVNNFHWYLVLQFDCRPVNLCITALSLLIQLCYEAAGSCCWCHCALKTHVSIQKKNNLRLNLYEKQIIVLILAGYLC
jgi:hypothetical protein